MANRRRCHFCHRLFLADSRVKERQHTCGRQECRRKRKRQTDQCWRLRHPDYFRGMYPQQKETYGTRAEYKKRYRQQHHDYVRRNTAYVKKSKARHRKSDSKGVSHTSCDLRLTVCSQKSNIEITQVSHTSRDIFVTLCQDSA